MSSLTRPSPSSHPDGRESRLPNTGPARPWRDGGVRLLGGAVAALLGLGLCAVVVLLLWIGTPRPSHSGPEGALHVAAAVWLAAHGAELVRTSTATGAPLPVGLTPLLLTGLPGWLLARAVRSALEEHGASVREVTEAVRAAASVTAGYLAAGAAVTTWAATGPVRVEAPWAALRFGLFCVLVTVGAAWLALGRPGPRLPRAARPVCRPALRAAALATGVLTAGGLLLALTAVAGHGGQALAGLERLSGSRSGDVAVLLLVLSLLPNAAVWAAAYGLGPGFTLGGGSTVAPLATTDGAGLPPFPLLAGVPSAESAGTPAALATCAVPLAAALGLGWYVGRAAAPVAAPLPRGSAAEDTLGPPRTALAAALGACGCGASLALLALLAGGPLGTGALAHLGPSWWATGAAALAWTGAVGVPVACAVRGWRLRERRSGRAGTRLRLRGPAPVPGYGAGAARGLRGVRRAEAAHRAEDWHETGARRTRWAALKEASGGLMADFPPRGRD